MNQKMGVGTARRSAAAALAAHDVRIPWVHVVGLATQAEQEAAASGFPTAETSLRLARAVLSFQQQMLGNGSRRSG